MTRETAKCLGHYDVDGDRIDPGTITHDRPAWVEPEA
jgi:hypothetical protein